MIRRLSSTALVIMALIAGCNDRRARPSAPELTPADLEFDVEIIQPGATATAFSGDSVSVVVRAREANGQLVGTGLVAKRFRAEVIDSIAVSFEATAESETRFKIGIPAELPTNAQIDMEALAFGSNGAVGRSQVRSIVVIQCTPNAVFC